MYDKSKIDILNRKYKRNLKLVEQVIGHTGETNGAELDRVAKFVFGDNYKGIYDSKDKRPKLRTGQMLIINKPTNQHWIGLAKVKGKTYQYDSFNRKMIKSGGYLNGDYDNRPDQRLDQANCGHRVIAWAITILSK